MQRWVPVVDEIVKACLDEKIEDGRIDFVDDLANVVPAVLTLGLLGSTVAGLGDLLRTRARVGVHPGRLPRRTTRHRPVRSRRRWR